MNTRNTFRAAFGWLVLSFLAACATTNDLDIAAIRNAEITNFRAPDGEVLASGQPTVSQLGIAARSGVKHVINLRTAQEQVDFNEEDVVESLGMEYHSIPIAGGAGVTAENAASLQQLLDRLDGEPVLVHCASSNRVGALMALTAHADGASVTGAIAEGERWGLTSERLQQLVRDNLGGN
ncbi:MAG: protein tyrosine phosphatase family protein [Pseudomonadales bacterium]|nr:protein tyrosine phosphatase family protein [Pseudomonadales bacterium]